jgi:hypothetical protein
MEFLLPFFKWCDSTWLGETIRDSRIYFPVIETFHLFALTVLLGAIIILDLRMCRIIMRRQPVRELALDLSPWAFWSLLMIMVSGILLFLSEALKCYASTPFQVKMVFLFTALIFHFTIHRKVSRAERDPSLFSGILVGTISLFLWFGVGLGGRAIGFL